MENTITARGLGYKRDSAATQDTRSVTKRERVVIDLSTDALRLFDELRVRTGAQTRAELFRNLLKFAAATLDEIENDAELVIREKDGKLYKAGCIRHLIWK